MLLYAAIGAFHWFARGPLLAVSSAGKPVGRSTLAVSAWDFVFFLSFGVVVASSVTTAGVLLVFSFLIVPAVIGAIFSDRMRTILAVAWSVGIAASAAALAGSYALDLPTGAAMVMAFAGFLLLAGLVKAVVLAAPAQRRVRLRVSALCLLALTLVLAFASSLWLMINPTADQPLAAVFEAASGLGPANFLSAGDRDTFDAAARDAVRFLGEVDRLNAREKSARFEGAPLPDEEIRRIASYQQSFNEMARGERFVQDVLRGKARTREAWIVGLPVAAMSLFGLALLGRRLRRSRKEANGARRTAVSRAIT
jgi:zinc/manganese transport system permease protein